MAVNWQLFWVLVVISVPLGICASTITKSIIFYKFREYMAGKSEKLGQLFGCPYCLSHHFALWFSFIFVGDKLIHGLPLFFNLFLNWFFLVGICQLTVLLCMKTLRAIGDVR